MERRNFLKRAGAVVSAASLSAIPVWGYDSRAEVDRVIALDDAEGPDELDAKLAKPVTAIVIGAGNRGGVYSRYAARYPKSLQIVGVSDINEFRRKNMAERFNQKNSSRLASGSRGKYENLRFS